MVVIRLITRLAYLATFFVISDTKRQHFSNRVQPGPSLDAFRYFGAQHFSKRFQLGKPAPRVSLFLRRSLRAQLTLHRVRADRQLRRDLLHRLPLVPQ